MVKRLAIAGVLLFAAVAAYAQPPRTLNHIDPNAPCFYWPAVDMDGDGVFDRVDHCVNTPTGCTVDPFGCSIDADGDGVCDGVDQCPDTPRGVKVDKQGCSSEQLAARGAPPPTPPVVTPPPPPPAPAPVPVSPRSETEKQLVEKGMIRLENVYFETNSAKLLPESEAPLNEAGAALEKYPDLRVEIEGHTDTRGAARYNMKLSQDRAESVRAYLVERFHLRAENLVAKGYGETRPETRERNDEELLRNRRVMLRVLNPDVLPRNVEIEKK